MASRDDERAETAPAVLGARWDGEGVHFAVASRHASRVEVCLFAGERGEVAEGRIELERQGDDAWRAFGAGLGPGQLYGLRVDGPYDPPKGHFFNPRKLLIDPYARAVSGELRPHAALHGHLTGREEWVRNDDDSASFVPRSVVVDDTFDWQGDRAPRTPWRDTVIYECHVKGMTRRHPEVPPTLRGTYLGLSHPAVVEHLLGLGITAVELLPVQHFVSRPWLHERGRRNYWGYDPVAWLAPHGGYATDDRGGQVREFKTMVREMHRAGLEVILDVVYNHSAEGHGRDSTFSLRGLDNASYYRSKPGEASLEDDVTGCGNTLDAGEEATRRLVLESLRYWVEEMHVDGFRFDLASTLGRGEAGFERHSPLLAAIVGDPVLSRVKLIAEPWDLGPEGFQSGGFPDGWAEWNPRFRDTARAFWRGDAGTLADLATRLAGSSDLFGGRDLGPAASLNFVTCHDGFTLHDLVSYERKHNLENGEGDRDGSDHNLSKNWGVEGPTDDPAVLSRRRRASRCLLATLAFSQGTPMLSHGDELGRTQQGNNNAYCQDNEVSWVDWRLDGERRALIAFVQEIFALRRRYPALRRERFFAGQGPAAGERQDATWLRPDGSVLREPADWGEGVGATLGLRIAPERPAEPTLLLLIHGSEAPLEFRLPEMPGTGHWHQVFHTKDSAEDGLGAESVRLGGQSVVLIAYE